MKCIIIIIINCCCSNKKISGRWIWFFQYFFSKNHPISLSEGDWMSYIVKCIRERSLNKTIEFSSFNDLPMEKNRQLVIKSGNSNQSTIIIYCKNSMVNETTRTIEYFIHWIAYITIFLHFFPHLFNLAGLDQNKKIFIGRFVYANIVFQLRINSTDCCIFFHFVCAYTIFFNTKWRQ